MRSERPRRTAGYHSHAVFASVLAAVVTGCTPRGVTEVVVRLDTDMVTGPAELSSVTLTVTRAGSLLQQLEYTLCPTGRHRLPGDVGFVALDSNGSSPLVFRVTAMHDRSTLFERAVQVTPMVGRTVAVDVYLARRCVGDTTVCANGGSCGMLDCELPQATVLPEDAGHHEPFDAGPCLTGDSGVVVDAGQLDARRAD